MSRNWSLKAKLLLINVTVSVILLLATSSALLQLASELARKESERQYQQILSVLDQDLIRALVFSKPDQISDLMRKLRSFRSLKHLYLYQQDGTPVLAYHRDETRPAPRTAAEKAEQEQTSEHFIAEQALTYKQQAYGHVRIEVETPPAHHFIRQILPHLSYLIPLLLGLSVLLALLLQQPITRPLEWLRIQLQQMAQQGQYDLVIPRRGEDEIGQLYDGVRELTQAVRQAQQQQREHVLRLQQILDRITDLIMEFDEQGNIHSINQAGRELLVQGETSPVHLRDMMLLSKKELTPLDIRLVAQSLDRPLQLSGLNLITDKIDVEVEAHLIPLERSGRHRHYLLILHPLSEDQQLRRELERQASIDRLTGLHNRMELERKLSHALKQQQTVYLLHLDVDRFHLVNETTSFENGDALLIFLAELLRQQLPEHAHLARFGGDEFAVMLTGCDPETVHKLAHRILAAVRDDEMLQAQAEVPITLSIGIADNSKAPNLTELLKNADASRQIAKQQGGNRYHFYRHNDDRLIQHNEELMLYTRIMEALNQHQLVLYYQRIEPTGEPEYGKLHFETLARIRCGDGSLLPPGLFMPVAERYQLAIEIDIQVITGVFHWFEQHPQLLEQLELVSINLSGTSLGNERLEKTILSLLEAGPLRGHQLCFELTETSAIENPNATLELIGKLRAKGCRFSLDDFGTGMSSLAYLKQFPADFLKLDGQFIRELETDPTNLALVRIFSHIGQVFGMETIAEFVESESLRKQVAELGIDWVQGYAIHEPEPFEHMLDET